MTIIRTKCLTTFSVASDGGSGHREGKEHVKQQREAINGSRRIVDYFDVVLICGSREDKHQPRRGIEF